MAKGLTIRRRVKSVKNTKSITKAMEMVAASKMRRAQEQALKTRDYAAKALEILGTLSSKINKFPHYLLQKPAPGHNSLILLITSNKGLCGSLNTNIIRKLLEFISHQEQNHSVKGNLPQTSAPSTSSAHLCSPLLTSTHFSFVTLGKKGRDAVLKMNHPVLADFSDLGDNLSFAQVTPIIKTLLDEYKSTKFQRVYVVYTHFLSVLLQKPIVKRIVPLSPDIFDSMKDINLKKNPPETSKKDRPYDYLFEPNVKEVLNELLPKFVEIQIYQAILESYASEHSARMVAMKNATDAADDLISDLNLAYNKLRQASITQEIAEIIRGVAALEKSNA